MIRRDKRQSMARLEDEKRDTKGGNRLRVSAKMLLLKPCQLPSQNKSCRTPDENKISDRWRPARNSSRSDAGAPTERRCGFILHNSSLILSSELPVVRRIAGRRLRHQVVSPL